MSLAKKVRIECNACRKVFFSQAWTYVNAKTDLWLKHKIISGETLKHRCPKCRTENWKEVDFLYFDPQKEFLIFLLHKRLLLVTDETVRLKIGDLPVTGDRYRYRVVSRHKDLVEKILIFDHDLYDYSIELLKELLTLEYLKDEKQRLPDEVIFSKIVQKEIGPELHFAIVQDDKVHPMVALGGDYEYVHNLIQEFALPEFRQQTWKSVGQEFVANFIPHMFGEQIRRNQLKNLTPDELERRVALLAVEMKEENQSVSSLLKIAKPEHKDNTIVLRYMSDILVQKAKEQTEIFQAIFRKYFGENLAVTFEVFEEKYRTNKHGKR